MNTKTFEMNVNDDYDIIVIGGGPAGCAAAAAAARRGVKTLLIEKSGFLGGMSSGGLVPEFCPYTDGEKIIHRGIAEEVLFKMKETTPETKDKLDYCAIDAERMKIILDDIVTGSGADVLFYTTVCGAEADGRAIYAANKSGLQCYTAKVFVDCTGDADVAAFFGCEFTVGDKNGLTQMPTLCFDVCNVNDKEKTSEEIENTVRSILPEIISDNEFSLIDNNFFCLMKLGSGVYGINAGHIKATDCLDAASISKGMSSGRRKAYQYLNALRKYLPDIFGAAHITATAPFLGVRETRRIIGEYTITAQDYITRRSFDDDIGRNCYHVDLHDNSMFYGNYVKNSGFEEYKNGESHGIPYRCLIPKNTDNILVAGRSVSCERAVQSSIRIIPVCFVTGEAAGTAASIMIEDNCTSRDVDIAKLQSLLQKI